MPGKLVSLNNLPDGPGLDSNNRPDDVLCDWERSCVDGLDGTSG